MIGFHAGALSHGEAHCPACRNVSASAFDSCCTATSPVPQKIAILREFSGTRVAHFAFAQSLCALHRFKKQLKAGQRPTPIRTPSLD
jgi:hypothetical protein